jgi:hypothetical protein
LTGTHEDDVAEAQLRDGHDFGAAFEDALRFVGKQLGQRRQRSAGAPDRGHLLPVAKQHDRHKGRQLPPELQVEQAGRRRKAGREGHGDGERDEQHHAGLAVGQFAPASDEEDMPAVDEDHCPQHGRDPVVAGNAAQRVSEPVLDHLAEQHDRDGQEQR